jgi:hypothetical protein
MGEKVNFAGDPSVAAGLGNLLGMLDPKSAAEGAALQARTRNFDAETGFNTAKTKALTDRGKWLADDAALAAAGFTPRQILAFRMTGAENGVSDLFGGVRTDTGTQMAIAPGGDKRTAGLLLNVPAALEKDAAFTPEEAERIRAAQIAADHAKAREVAIITQQGANSRSAAKTKAAEEKEKKEGDKNEKLVFTPEQINGPVRQAIVDLYSEGSKEGKDFAGLDEGVIREILDTQQTLIATGLSTRSTSLSDALSALGYINSTDRKNRYDKQVSVTDRPGAGTGDDIVRTITPKKAADLDLGLDEVEKRVYEGEIPRDAFAPGTFTGSVPYDVPLARARDILPQIRDNAELGDTFKIGNRIYQKVQLQDGSFALQAIR